VETAPRCRVGSGVQNRRNQLVPTAQRCIVRRRVNKGMCETSRAASTQTSRSAAKKGMQQANGDEWRVEVARARREVHVLAM